MKYICTLNGKKYEVQVEKLDDFTPLTRAAAAAPAPAAAPAIDTSVYDDDIPF